MTEEIDNTDKKIIYEIDLNPRTSLIKLAKKLRINRNTLEHRIERLIKKGFIKNFFCIVNGFNLGFEYYKYFIKIKEPKKEFSIEKLFNEKEIVWAGKVDGYWDFAITLRVKTREELTSILDKINYFIEISDKTLEIINSATIFNERWLTKTDLTKEITNKLYETKINIDKKDITALRLLSLNGREKLVNIADKLKLTPEAVNKRIKNLEKNKIILGYKAKVNYSLFGYDYFHLLLTLKNTKSKKEILYFLKNLSNCVTIIELTGKYDIQAELLSKRYADIREVIEKIKQKFHDDIEIIEKLFVIEESNIKTFE
ncbi:hypothetical protein A3K73_04795 [Candidatus Pacearchaeota archaeon RBG_13_36_9]|nr:MAG: hypothetical protein A3K73_04795 [Candidatus Pacearchaeota archaeon RBG_13_36_9]HJX50285.1 Lrp/AsnC family transcriptional regulator [Candidatus Nanoarchaeia archaeon]